MLILAGKEITYYCTRQRFPATNLVIFMSDGRIKPEIDVETAMEIHRQLEKIIDKKTK